MSNALTIDKDLTLKIESQIDDLRRYKDSIHLQTLLVAVEEMLGSEHLLVAILRSIFAYDLTGVIGMSARFFSTGIRDTLVSMSEAKAIVQGVVETTAATAESATATAAGNYFVFGMSSFQVIPLSYY
jgi:deoxyhypusine synthase